MKLIIEITETKTLLNEDAYTVSERNEETGEIRELTRLSVESAFRTLGHHHDKDRRR